MVEAPHVADISEIADAASALLRSIGVSDAATLHAIPGGANHRVFRLSTGRLDWFLKSFVRHPDDPGGRLSHDWAFSRLAWDHGLTNVAQPLACDNERLLGLYEFVVGTRPAPYDLDEGLVEQAAGFLRDFNRLRRVPRADAIPAAFGATFSIADRVAVVARRVGELQVIAPSSPVAEAAAGFARGRLASVWSAVQRDLAAMLSPDETRRELPVEERCLSPVDFGFHNVLVRPDGRCVFHDFEYAGWDDPARLACEFFLQVQPSVPREFAAVFLDVAFGEYPHQPDLRRRMDALWPLLRVEWCCRVLNDFLPPAVTRQQYAGQPPSELRRTRQLEMACAMLDRPMDDRPWQRSQTG